MNNAQIELIKKEVLINLKKIRNIQIDIDTSYYYIIEMEQINLINPLLEDIIKTIKLIEYILELIKMEK